MSDQTPATIGNLIAALEIFRKYGDITYPTHCEHDVMYVGVPYSRVSAEDKEALVKLGFHQSDDDMFKSYRYGSA